MFLQRRELTGIFALLLDFLRGRLHLPNSFINIIENQVWTKMIPRKDMTNIWLFSFQNVNLSTRWENQLFSAHYVHPFEQNNTLPDKLKKNRWISVLSQLFTARAHNLKRFRNGPWIIFCYFWLNFSSYFQHVKAYKEWCDNLLI